MQGASRDDQHVTDVHSRCRWTGLVSGLIIVWDTRELSRGVGSHRWIGVSHTGPDLLGLSVLALRHLHQIKYEWMFLRYIYGTDMSCFMWNFMLTRQRRNIPSTGDWDALAWSWSQNEWDGTVYCFFLLVPGLRAGLYITWPNPRPTRGHTWWVQIRFQPRHALDA